MADIIRSIILGIIQGFTEFLPVSSSGHLELARVILQDDSAGQMGLLMTVVLHFATALATIIVFWKDILALLQGLFKGDSESIKYAFFIFVSMIPAAVIGVFFDDLIESLFTKQLLLVGLMLLVTAALLFFADRYTNEDGPLTYGKSLLIGIAQAVAILPGVSRSGATISTALLLNVKREQAARFSFLMVVPLILGKMAKDVLDGDFSAQSENMLSIGVGFLAALICGYIACKWMIQIVKRAKLSYFAIYCTIVGLIAITYSLL